MYVPGSTRLEARSWQFRAFRLARQSYIPSEKDMPFARFPVLRNALSQ